MTAPIKGKLSGFDQSPEWVEQGFILIQFSVPVGTVVYIGAEYEITEAPAPAASSPVPQAATGTVAEPSAAAAPVARTERYGQCDSTCTADCGHCKGAGAPAASVARGRTACWCGVPAGGAS